MATKKIQILDYNIKQSENSDTLDGKHASDFASASDMTTAKSNIGELQTKVGDKSVSSQISTAIASKADTDHTHTKSEVGLGNVDNTADADKSVKYATSAGSADSITGVVDIAHGGTGSSTRDLALTALFAGGSGGTDANIVASGTYVLTTETASNLPPEPGYYLLFVFRYHTSDLACGQIAINLGNGNLYSRNYVTGDWRDWVCCSSQKIDTILIPNGADLNNYKDKGFYTSNRSSNAIANLPSDLGSGAFELVVTGIAADGLYCTQWLKSYERNKVWVRTQVSSKEPWVWRDWEQVVMSGTSVLTPNGIELGELVPSTVGHGGYIDFHFNGSTADYTSRLIETDNGVIRDEGSFVTAGYIQSFGGLWVSGRGFFVNSTVYGTSLPAAGTAGRVFFKKV